MKLYPGGAWAPRFKICARVIKLSFSLTIILIGAAGRFTSPGDCGVKSERVFLGGVADPLVRWEQKMPAIFFIV